jgi:PAS domain S-box-containing protein
MRLQKKLILLITLSIFLFVVFTSVYFARIQKNNALKNLEDRSAALVKVLSFASSTQLFWGNYDRLNQYARKIKETLPVKFVAIVDQTGTVMAHTERVRIGQQITFSDDFNILSSKDIMYRYNGEPESTYSVSYPVFILDKIVGYMILQYDTTFIEEEISDIFVHSFNLALILGLFGVIISAYVSRRIAQPIEAVVTGMDRIASGDYKHKIKINEDTLEVSRLAQAFNNMGQRLEAAIQKLDREKSQSEAIITSMSDGLMLIDPDKRVRFLNKGAEKILGYSSESARGKICSEIFNSSFCDSENCSLFCDDSSAGHESLTETDLQIVITNKDGKNISLLKSTAPLVNLKGEVYGGVEVFKDITELLTMERKLKEADRLSSIGMMAAGMAHEINNPISGIIGLANALLRDFSGDKLMEEDMKIIKEQGERCGRIIKNLMRLAVNTPKELAMLNINTLVHRTSRIVARSFTDSKMIIKESYDTSSPMVSADEGQLMQVFINIIKNAIAATEGVGMLNISTIANNGFVEIVFSDNGIGIPEASLTRVFDPFFTTKRLGEGMGLGLAVSHGIITSHGGKIKTESKVGKGTKFTIVLKTCGSAKTGLYGVSAVMKDEESVAN